MPPLKKRKLSHDGESSDDASQRSSNALSGNSEVEENADAINETPTTAVTTFKELGIVDSLCEACESLGYKTPTPIQAQSIPLALQGRDLIGLAETGSGKTAAFVLPILQDLLKKAQPLHSLILAPTRELAYQISHVVEALGSLIGVRCVVLVGGMANIPQAIALGKKPHIIVATPGRLIDHLENTKGFSLRQLKYLVMDEADRLLDLDFGPTLLKILGHLPKPGRKTYLFSATMSRKVEDLQRASLSNPVRVSVSQDKYQTVSTLIQSYLFVPFKHKDLYLVHILNEMAGQTGIIFTRTVNEAQRISILLGSLGFSAIPIHGGLSQPARLAALNKFRAKSRKLLVASDVAARGLDIPSVDMVVNFDLPHDSKTYIHRVGRTARAGKSGKAISFVTQYDVELWMRIEDALQKKLNEYETVKEEVMVLAERVEEARRAAVMKMKELHEDRDSRKKGSTLKDNRVGKGAKGKRQRDDMDQDEG